MEDVRSTKAAFVLMPPFVPNCPTGCLLGTRTLARTMGMGRKDKTASEADAKSCMSRSWERLRGSSV